MNLVITGKQLELTEAMKEMVSDELTFLEKLEEFSAPDKTVSVTLEAHPVHKATVLFYYDKEPVRFEQTGDDLYVLFPQVSKRLAKHLRGLKQLSRAFKKERADYEQLTPMSADATEVVEAEAVVTKRKSFEMKPMSEREAVLQMKMLGHEQFIFANADLDNTICLLYTRKDGYFGVIETTY